MINFVYENPEEWLNLTSCKDINTSGIGRVTISPVCNTIARLIKYKRYENLQNSLRVVSTPPENEKYIVPVGVAHSPYDWCGPDQFGNGGDDAKPNKKSLFAFISETLLKDMQEGRAYLLIDQTHEGYQTDWLWQWFHNNCTQYQIDPRQIIYLTGNMDAEKQYKSWADSHNLISRMLVGANAHFELVIYEVAKYYNHPTFHLKFMPGPKDVPDFKTHLDYKMKDLSRISMFNILQKRTRVHRLWFFKHLYEAGLIENNIVTMNKFEFDQTYYENRQMLEEEVEELNSILPLMPKEHPGNANNDNFVSSDGGNYILTLNEQTMLDSWCTTISEASYGDHDNTCFISEKTFKPIAGYHPFIMLGSKGSLKNLQDMGYKTFHPFINESYDELSSWPRMRAVTNEMVRLNKMTDDERLEWFKSVEPILEHNFKVLHRRGETYPLTFINFIKAHLDQ